MAIDAGIDEYWGHSSMWLGRQRRPRTQTCRRCGQKGLFWSEGPPYHLEESARDRFDRVIWVRHTCKMKGKFGKYES